MTLKYLWNSRRSSNPELPSSLEREQDSGQFEMSKTHMEFDLRHLPQETIRKLLNAISSRSP